MRLHVKLLTFICQSYVDGSFVFGFVKILLGLDDINFLTRLPITGKAVCVDRSSAHERWVQLLGMTIPETQLDISLKELKNQFEKVPANEDIEKHVRGHLLFLIGCFGVVLSQSDSVPIELVSLLEDISSIDVMHGVRLHGPISIVVYHLMRGIRRGTFQAMTCFCSALLWSASLN